MIIGILVILFLILSFVGILSYAFEKPKVTNRTININVNINIEDDGKDGKTCNEKLIEGEQNQI